MIVVGNGRVGQGLRRRAEAFGLSVSMVTRTHGSDLLGASQQGPVLVCINAGDIRSFATDVPAGRRSDLVFVQNGMIRPALVDVGCSDNTLGLLYFAVPSLGDSIQPGGTSLFCGAHAEAVVTWFQAMELAAKGVSRMDYTQEMISKLIWNCTFGLLCDVHDQSVGMVVEQHSDVIGALVGEFCLVANQALEIELSAEHVAETACAYSMTIPQYQGSMKQWEWRNGWFVQAAQKGMVSTPTHVELLRRMGRMT